MISRQVPTRSSFPLMVARRKAAHFAAATLRYTSGGYELIREGGLLRRAGPASHFWQVLETHFRRADHPKNRSFSAPPRLMGLVLAFFHGRISSPGTNQADGSEPSASPSTNR